MKFLLLLFRFFLVIFQRTLAVLSFGEWPPFASVAIVVEQNGKFLVVKRRDGLGYGLPGGFIRMDESAEAAAVREVREETGYVVELNGILGILSGPRTGTAIRTTDIVFSATIAGGSLQSSSEGAASWQALDDIRDQLAFDYIKVLAPLAAHAGHTSLR